MRTQICKARQSATEMRCAECGLAWDMNDPEPPECRKVDRRTREGQRTVRFEQQLKREKVQGLPEKLPADVVRAMAHAARNGQMMPSYAAIEAAYRVMRDMLEI